jgi:putative ABC transport system permease protein
MRFGVVAVLVLVSSALVIAQDAPSSVLISRQLAESRQLRVGDTVRLSTESTDPGARGFRVAGIYEPIPDPTRINASKHEIRLHLPDILDLTRDPRDPLSIENVDAVNIALVPGTDAAAFSRDLMARLPGISAQPVATASPAGLFVVLERFHLAIALVTVIASTVFLLALTVMLVDERRDTVGVLRLMGLTSRRILLQVFFEGLLIAAVGALFGIALAAASQGLINRFFQWRYDTVLVFVEITPRVAFQCLVIAVPLGVIGTVVASWALLRRNALRLVRR